MGWLEGGLSLLRSLESCNGRRIQSVNLESVKLSALSRPYWGGWRAASVCSDIWNRVNCRRFQRVNIESVKLSALSRSYCRRFQRVNPESAQLSAISRPYCGGWRMPSFSSDHRKSAISRPYWGGWRMASVCTDHWNRVTVDDSNVSTLKV